MRAIIGGMLASLAVAYPALAAVFWHATTWATAATGDLAGWTLHQPAAVVALGAIVGWRYLARRMRGRTA